MTKRDFLWLVIGWWGATILVAGSIWWQDHKTGVKSVEVPVSWTHSMEQMEQVKQVAETHEQIKETTQINDEKFIKHFAALERRLKKLEVQLAAQMAMLDQYKGQREVLVASKPLKSPERVTVESGQLSAKYVPLDTLPPIKLMQLAKEVGFKKVEVR